MAPSDSSRPQRREASDSQEHPPSKYGGRYMRGDFDRGWDMSVEMIAAILTWGGVGYLLDRWLHTSPWLMVVGFLLGNCCGIYLVWIRASAEERKERERVGSAATTGDTEGPTSAKR